MTKKSEGDKVVNIALKRRVLFENKGKGRREQASGSKGEILNKQDKKLAERRVIYNGEFDPGSERTLAARLKHASRAGM